MNANYLFDVFRITDELDLSDLTFGLARLRAEQPIPEGMTDKGIRLFISRHYDALVKAYRFKDRAKFAEVVDACVKKDEENKKDEKDEK